MPARKADAWTHGGGVTCSVTKNIVNDYSANNTNTASVATAFNNFHTDAVAANPSVVCLTIPSGTYGFWQVSGVSNWTSGIKNLVVNASGPSSTILTDTATTLAASSATSNTITFSSLPATVINGQSIQDATTPSAIPDGTLITVSGNTVTASNSITVAPGDQIKFLGNGFTLGNPGVFQDNTHHANAASVSAGSSCITLNTPAQVSLFNIGDVALMSGIELQFAGYPPNLGVFEYPTIQSKNAGTGVVCFTSSLQYSYESQWPNYFAGSAFEAYGGGPPTLYALDQGWVINQQFNNFGTVLNTSSLEIQTQGRFMTFNNVAFTGGAPYASRNDTWTCNNCDTTNAAQIEMDKIFNRAVFNGGTIGGAGIKFQSANVADSTTFNNVTIIGSVIGTGGQVTFNNTPVAGGLLMGAIQSGQTKSVSCSNSSFATGLTVGGFLDTSTNDPSSTMSSGVIHVPIGVTIPIVWAQPLVEMYWKGGTYLFNQPFSVIDFTATPATSTDITTDQAGGFPTVPGGAHSVATSSARLVNFSGCSGSPDIVDMSQAAARNARPFTRSNRIYTCTSNVATIQAANPGVPVIDANNPPNGPLMARAIVSLIANVSIADSSASPSVNLHLGGVFDNYQTVNSSGSSVAWAPIIDLKMTGSRVYTGSSSSWSGSKPNDTLPTVANPSYMTGAMPPAFDANISGHAANTCPVVTVTIQTN